MKLIHSKVDKDEHKADILLTVGLLKMLTQEVKDAASNVKELTEKLSRATEGTREGIRDRLNQAKEKLAKLRERKKAEKEKQANKSKSK
jgi:uncharacterized membrane protein